GAVVLEKLRNLDQLVAALGGGVLGDLEGVLELVQVRLGDRHQQQVFHHGPPLASSLAEFCAPGSEKPMYTIVYIWHFFPAVRLRPLELRRESDFAGPAAAVFRLRAR